MKKLFLKYPIPLILLLALVLRLPLLSGSFWMDEAAQALEVIRPFSQQLNIVADFQPPLLHYILHFAQYFSHSEWFLRTIGALIPGLITVHYLYRFAEAAFNKKTALLAAIFLATSSFHVYFSQELRPYALPAMLAMMSMYYFYKVCFTKRDFPVGKIDWVALTLVNALGLYASYLYPFFLIAQGVIVLLTLPLKKWRSISLSFVTSAVAFVPLLPLFLQQLAEGGVVRTQLPGWDQVVSIPQLQAVPLVFGKLLFGILPIDLTPFVVLMTLAVGLSVLVLLFAIATKKRSFWSLMRTKTFSKKSAPVLLIILLWLIVPVLTAWLISFSVPVVRPKRLLFILPALSVFFAYLSLEFWNHKKRIYKTAATALTASVLLINAFGLLQYYTQPKLQRENWRSLHQEMTQLFSKEDTILVYSFPNQFAPMQWYELQQETPFKYLATGVLYIETLSDIPNTLKRVSEYKTVLVFDYLRDLSDPERKIESALYDLGFQEVGVLDYPNIGFVRIFMKPDTLLGSLQETNLQAKEIQLILEMEP